MNAWDDSNVVAAIEKTGRKKIVLAGQANSSRHFMRELNRLGVTSIIDAGGMFQNGCGSHSGQIFENLIEQAVEGYPIRGRGDAQNVD
jgi:predicted amidohydrolase YtcJ